MRPRFLPRPPNMRRVVVVVPSLFTLFNLFFGIWSMSRGFSTHWPDASRASPTPARASAPNSTVWWTS